MSESQKVLLVWGAVLLFVVLGVSLPLGPKAETASELVKSAHGHALCLAIVMLVMGLLQPYMGLSEWTRQLFGGILGLGSTLLPIGVLIEFDSKAGGVAIAMFSAILVVISIFVFMIALIARAVST